MTCSHDGELEWQPGQRRAALYWGVTSLIPDDLLLPTCPKCGEWFLNRKSAPILDEALTIVCTKEVLKLYNQEFICTKNELFCTLLLNLTPENIETVLAHLPEDLRKEFVETWLGAGDVFLHGSLVVRPERSVEAARKYKETRK